MFARQPAFASLSATVVLLLVGCSSGGKQSVPATPTTASAGVLPGGVVGDSGPLNAPEGPLVSRVPNVVGMSGSRALALLSVKRFVVSSRGTRCCTGAIVIGQSPNASRDLSSARRSGRRCLAPHLGSGYRTLEWRGR